MYRYESGKKKYKMRDGTELVIGKSGLKTQTNPDGKKIQLFPDGRKTTVNPDGTKVGSDGPLWTRFASSRSPLDELQYVNRDRSPWIPRGEGVYDNSTKSFRGEWDSGMAFALQGLLQSRSTAQQQ